MWLLLLLLLLLLLRRCLCTAAAAGSGSPSTQQVDNCYTLFYAGVLLVATLVVLLPCVESESKRAHVSEWMEGL